MGPESNSENQTRSTNFKEKGRGYPSRPFSFHHARSTRDLRALLRSEVANPSVTRFGQVFRDKAKTLGIEEFVSAESGYLFLPNQVAVDAAT